VPVIETFRVTFWIDDAAERQRLATELRGRTTGGDVRIVGAFADATTVKVYVDIAESAVPREVVADQFARRFDVDRSEVTPVEPLPTEPISSRPAIDRGRFHPAAITQMRVHPDGRTISVQARHRPYETVGPVEVEETDEAVSITVLVGTPDDDVRDQYVSFAVTFIWVDAFLERPVGDRQIIRYDPDRGASRS
jgi:hypothetical protein